MCGEDLRLLFADAQPPLRSRVEPNCCSATHCWLTVPRSACRSRPYHDTTSAITIPASAIPPTNHAKFNVLLFLGTGSFPDRATGVRFEFFDSRLTGSGVRVRRATIGLHRRWLLFGPCVKE